MRWRQWVRIYCIATFLASFLEDFEVSSRSCFIEGLGLFVPAEDLDRHALVFSLLPDTPVVPGKHPMDHFLS